MRSARTDAGVGPIRPRCAGWFQRLNVRLVLALASVALVALLVSGVALSQILPGYFVEQADARAETPPPPPRSWCTRRAARRRRPSRSCSRPRSCANTQLLQPVAQSGRRDARAGNRRDLRHRRRLAGGARRRRRRDGRRPARGGPAARPGVPAQSAALDDPDSASPPSGPITVSEPVHQPGGHPAARERHAHLRRAGRAGRVAVRGAAGRAPIDRPAGAAAPRLEPPRAGRSSTSGRRASASWRSTTWRSSST